MWSYRGEHMAKRDDLMRDISEMLSIPVVPKGVGSSVHNDFIDPLANAVLGTELAETFHDKYRKIDAVITALGGTYVPGNPVARGTGDTSEGTSSGGGGTLTNLGLLKIRDLLIEHGVPTLELDSSASPAELFEQGFTPQDVLDTRVRVLAQVATRPGASAFRESVREAYNYRCCITGADMIAGLEAAHIAPYRGPESDRVDNALLLRADLHKLHDALLVAVSDEDLTVLMKPSVRDSSYGELAGVQIAAPAAVKLSSEALRFHRNRCGL